jgi:two-component system, NarL family, nitrate/nitrite response regulator NarL
MTEKQNTGDSIRVLLADDHTLFRQGLRHLLADHPRLNIVGEAADAEDAVRQARRLAPDVILMDLHMPGGGGIEATRILRGELPNVNVLILTVSENEEDLLGALRAGAKGYILKTSDFDQLLRSLDTVASGQAALAPEMTTKLLTQLSGDEAAPTAGRRRGEPHHQLSERELEILRLIAQGASNRSIANQLYLSQNTVRTHLVHILGKLGLENRVQVAAYALRNGLAS